MYPTDFSAAEPVYAPVEDPIFLGLPPLLAVLLLLLFIIAIVGAYRAGQRAAGDATGEGGQRAAEGIYAVILRYAVAARAASSNDLKQKAEDLQRKIDDYLGPVLLIGRDMGGPLKALKGALDGKAEEPAKPAVAKEDPKAPTCGCGGHGTPRGCTCGAPAHAAAAHPVAINQIYIGGVPAPAPTHPTGDHGPGQGEAPVKAGKSADAPAPPTVKRDMTTQEQAEALDKAVRAFNDYWLVKDLRIAELRAAQRALLRRPPASDVNPLPSARVWDRR